MAPAGDATTTPTDTEPAGTTALFRPEAIAHQRSFRGPGKLLALGPRRDERLFWALVALVAAGVAAAGLVRIDGEPLLTALVPQLRGALGPL